MVAQVGPRTYTSSALLLHQLCAAPTPALHCTYTSSASHPYQLCTATTPALHRTYTSSVLYLHQLCTAPTPALHRTHTSSALQPHQLCTAPTPALHRTYTSSALHLHQLYTVPTPALHCTYTSSALHLHQLCSAPTPALHCTCTLPALHPSTSVARAQHCPSTDCTLQTRFQLNPHAMSLDTRCATHTSCATRLYPACPVPHTACKLPQWCTLLTPKSSRFLPSHSILQGYKQMHVHAQEGRRGCMHSV